MIITNARYTTIPGSNLYVINNNLGRSIGYRFWRLYPDAEEPLVPLHLYPLNAGDYFLDVPWKPGKNICQHQRGGEGYLGQQAGFYAYEHFRSLANIPELRFNGWYYTVPGEIWGWGQKAPSRRNKRVMRYQFAQVKALYKLSDFDLTEVAEYYKVPLIDPPGL